MKLNDEGSKCLLIIDESHLMSVEIFNGIRLLNNLEIGSSKLIQVLLLGQQEIMEIINRPEMEPFKQRIATLENMGKMNTERIRKYISYRIEIAGGSSSLFAETGWEALNHAFGSENIPRLINSLCDKSLTVAFENRKSAVDVDDVYKAAEGLGLQKEVFFYKIKLKKQNQESHTPSNGDSATTETPVEKDEHLAVDNSTSAAPVGQKVKSAPAPERQFRMDFPYEEEESSKKPMIFFILSVAALILSTLFYCQKSNSSDLISCIFELIGL
jgi:general secretion pathway protein A